MANSILKISNSNVLNQFLHNCADDLIGRKCINFDSYSSDIEWTKQDYTDAMSFIQNLYRELVLSNDQDLFDSKIEDFNPALQKCVKDCYEIRKLDILQAVIRQHLARTDKLIVENIDWKLKWVMGSSKLANLREPVLQMDLHCLKKENEQTRSSVNFEMNLEQVTRLIEELEKVQTTLKTDN